MQNNLYKVLDLSMNYTFVRATNETEAQTKFEDWRDENLPDAERRVFVSVEKIGSPVIDEQFLWPNYVD